MPNHISNILSVVNSDYSEESKQFKEIEALMKSKDRIFDFNNLIEYPTEYRKADEERQNAMKELQKLPKEQQDWSKLPQDGYNNGGYEWRIKNWGTRWNAYTASSIYGYIAFQTAWNTPLEIFTKLSEKLPHIKFKVKYADEDLGNNCGVLYFKDGKLLKKISKKGRKVWAELLILRVERNFYFDQYYQLKNKAEK